MKEYDIYASESEDEYIYRICKLKSIIGTWNEVAEILNKNLNHDYDESCYRKKFQSFEKLLEANKALCGDIDSRLQDLQEQTEKLRAERYKMQALNVSRAREERHSSRFDLFYEQVSSIVQAIDPPDIIQINVKESEHKWVLGFGDIHYGANFKSINNEYSTEICRQRFSILFSKLVKLIEKEHIKELTIVNVADSIQGLLRMTDFQINEIAVVTAVVEISRILAEFINKLSAYVYVDYYHVPAANHSQTRPLGSKASEVATEDLEKLIINYISDLLKNNERVTVHNCTDGDCAEFSIYGFNCIAIHGHQIKCVEDTVKDLSNIRRKLYDYVFCGHRHSANEIIAAENGTYNIEILTCPSMVGSDPYADRLMVGSRPMAKLYEFDETEGHISSRNLMLNN